MSTRLSAAARRERIELAATEVIAERGYHGAAMDEIARRAGITVPVVYDHFSSKQELHRRLLERHFAELRGVWAQHFPGQGPLQERLASAFDAWFTYVEDHPFAWKLLFRDTTGDAGVQAVHAEVAAASRAALLPLLAAEPDAGTLFGGDDDVSLELAWEVMRSVLQGLAPWWLDHPQVPRERLVTTAMNAFTRG